MKELPTVLLVSPDVGQRKLLEHALPENGFTVYSSANTHMREVSPPLNPSIYVLDESSELEKSKLHAPYVITTQSNNSHKSAVLFNEGADLVISSPYEPDVLASHMRAILRRHGDKGKENQKSLKAKDIEMTPDGRVMVGDTLVEMSPQELDILSYLLIMLEKQLRINRLLARYGERIRCL